VTLSTALPPPVAPDRTAYVALRETVRAGGVVALTGAGMSTASGIPDYRGPDGQRRVTPMQHAEFVGSREARRRYWARSYVGWQRLTGAAPNESHRAVAELQRAGLVTSLITQNVDGLHQAAGSPDVLELHGNLRDIRCLTCDEVFDRAVVHEWIAAANPDFSVTSDQVRPDGDINLAEDDVAGFRLVTCVTCGSDLLKPDVVFFGGSVPRDRVERAYAAVGAARALLVLGSSLQVMSGLRFVRRAHELGIPVLVVTRGSTRREDLVDVKLDALLSDVLPPLCDELLRRG
jgi:NAD-dependent SIR2 family protein deacetylase